MSHTLKILVISHRVPFPPNKGEKLRTYHQLERLTELGHTISLIAPQSEAEDIKHAEGLANIFSMRVKISKLPHKIFRFCKALLTGRSLSEANFYSPSTKKAIADEAKHFAPDFVLFTASSLIKYADAFKTLQPRPTLLTDFMDVDSNKWQQYEQKSTFPMSWVYKRESELVKSLEVEATQLSKECYLIAAAEVDLFKRDVYNTDSVKILPNGIDSNIFTPLSTASGKGEQTLLFTGVMDYKPNIDAVFWFIENCWPAIINKHPKAKFIIAGMNPTPAVQKLTSDGSIVVTGFVDDIMPYFQNASVFVAPFQIARGVQNKVLQAMSCELPVVTTSRGIEGIVHNDGEDVLIADSANAYANLCLSLLDSQKLRVSIGKAARQTILSNYAWPEVLKPLTQQISSDT